MKSFRALFLFFSLTCLSLQAGPIPPALVKALEAYKAEGTKGWSFTQSTESGGQSQVERFDAARVENKRWSLLQKNGKEPNKEDLQTYDEMLSRKTRGDTAPNVKDQIAPETCEALENDGTHARYRFRLKRGGEDDRSAEHLAVTFSLHVPTGVIDHVQLASTEPFSPMFSVKIEEMKTDISYTLPTATEPVHLEKIAVKIRGRAMWLKSLDQDMTVAYSDYLYPFPKH